MLALLPFYMRTRSLAFERPNTSVLSISAHARYTA